jgi:hypothetical protein
VVIVAEKGDATAAWSFLNIGILQLVLLRCTVCQVKMVVNACGS